MIGNGNDPIFDTSSIYDYNLVRFYNISATNQIGFRTTSYSGGQNSGIIAVDNTVYIEPYDSLTFIKLSSGDLQLLNDPD